MSDFTLTSPTQEAGFDTAMQVIYQWNYDAEVDELRRLYVKATEAQWISERDIDWSRDIDLDLFTSTPIGFGMPVDQTSYYKSLPVATRQKVTTLTASFRLSNFLHGEQGALMVAAQLVNAVPHTDAKFYAATQTMDEARHVEVFAKYIEKLDEIRPIAPAVKQVLDATLQTDNWMKKLVGMQIVVEGLALYSFREMRNLTLEPLLKDVLTYVARDEARHHAYGVQYIERCAPLLDPQQREELEDFALEAAQTLIDQRSPQTILSSLLPLWMDAGVDPVELFQCLQREREELLGHDVKGRRLGPVQGFVIPTLKRCGLFSERVAGRFHEFLQANLGAEIVGKNVEEFMGILPELPSDTARWVMGEGA